MYVVIVGAGEVGSYLARILVEEKHDVAVIEADEALCRRLESQLDGLVVHGSGVSRKTLESAGISRADLVIAVTQVDEVNLIACMTAIKYGRKPLTVARVRQIEYLMGESHLSAEDMGVSCLVGPERAVADHVIRLLSFVGTGEIRYLAGNRIVLLELALSNDSPLVHETLAELRDVLPAPSLIAGIYGDEGLRIPHGGDKMAATERADILTVPENIEEFLILSGKPWHRVKHVLIIGCGTIGLHLALQLEAQRLYPTIIEIDRDRAEHVSKRLTKSLVLCGDGTDPDLLREKLEEAADAVVVLLEDDEKSTLVGVFAKHLGAKKVIVRSDKLAYAPIAHKVGIDALLSPRRAVADAILRFVRRGRIEGSVMLGDHEGEIIELTVPDEPENRHIIELPLKEIDFPAGALMGAVIRDDAVTLATGDTVLAPGDQILVVAQTNAIARVEELLG